MSSRSLLISLVIVLCAAATRGRGQAVVTDTVAKSKMFIPTMYRIGVDAVSGVSSIVSSQKSGWEIQTELDIYSYFLVGEFGKENLNIEDTEYLYTSNGNYWRLGIDANLIPREAFGSVLYFGFRYGRASFNDSMIGTNNEPFWGETPIDQSNTKVSARWMEMVAGMKAKVWKNMYLGYALRLKFAKKIVDKEELKLDPFRIPGYGLADQRSFWGVNYYIAWIFPFREKYMLPPKQ